MTRRMILVGLAALALSLAVTVAAPHPAHAVSFVDKQVQASALLLQNYINVHGQSHRFAYPPPKMVKKGGGLTTPIWPANPWTGKVFAPGGSRGTYRYTLGAGGTSYKLTVYLSKGEYVLRGGMPRWLKIERDTAARHNQLLLQRYLETWAARQSGVYPAAADVTAAAFGAGFVWPTNPWTGTEMAASSALGDFSYAQLKGGASYSLKVMLTSGWSSGTGPVGVAAVLAAAR